MSLAAQLDEARERIAGGSAQRAYWAGVKSTRHQAAREASRKRKEADAALTPGQRRLRNAGKKLAELIYYGESGWMVWHDGSGLKGDEYAIDLESRSPEGGVDVIDWLVKEHGWKSVSGGARKRGFVLSRDKAAKRRTKLTLRKA